MRYDGGARTRRPDGSIELVGRPSLVYGALLALLVAVLGLIAAAPDVLPPFVIAAGIYAGVRLWRFPWRVVVFDAGARVLRITDRGLGRTTRRIPFSELRAVAVEQREPRRIRFSPPELVVNGEALLSVADTHANAALEREL